MRDRDRDRDFWEKRAAQYDRVATGLFGRPLPRVLELVANGVSGADTVLEVAAGTGLITAAIAPCVRRVVATDYSDNMLAILQQRMQAAGISHVEAVHRDIYALGYPAGSFDVVIAGNVLHLVPDLEKALDALSYVLRPGGKLIAPTFVHGETRLSRLVSRLVVTFLGQPVHRRLTTGSLRQALEDRGLQVSRHETIPGVIPVAYVEGIV